MTQLRSHKLLPLTALLVAALASGCSKKPEPAPTAAPTQTAAAKPTVIPTGHPPLGAAMSNMTKLEWDVPAGWETAPNVSQMRRATYKIKRAEGDSEDAELTVTQAGGSVDDNIKRWIGQYETAGADAVKQSERTVNELKIKLVEIHGNFKGSGMPAMPGMSSDPKSSQAMLGAIVLPPKGGPLWFFKLTGPDKTVTAAKADFDKLVESIRQKK